jgi:hypothetical protein
MWDWINCRLLRRHEHAVWCENGTIFLRCLRCGQRSQGWAIGVAGSGRPFKGRVLEVRRETPRRNLTLAS